MMLTSPCIQSVRNGIPEYNHVWGNSMTGILQYSASGQMAAVLTSTDPELRPRNLSVPFPADEPNSPEWALVGKHALGYAGPFTVAEGSTKTSGTLLHGPLTVANVPSMEGIMVTRNYTMFWNSKADGGADLMRLVLGTSLQHIIWWRRNAD